MDDEEEIGIGLAKEPLQERPTSPQYDSQMQRATSKEELKDPGPWVTGILDTERRMEAVAAKKAQASMAQLQVLAARFDTAKKVIDAGGHLSGAQRKKFLEAASVQFDETSPEFSETFRLMAERPDITGALEDISNTPTGQAMLQADPSGQTLLGFIKTEAGQKALNAASDKRYLPTALKKLNLAVRDAEKYVDKEKLARIRKDGKTTIAELQEMNESMPENLRLSPQEFSTVMHSRNQNTLLQFGIKTDEMIEFEEKERSKTAVKGSKVTKSDRIMELSSKMARGKATNEEKKEYRLLINADPIRQLINREVDPLLEDEAEEPKGEIPQVKSDADYDKLPSGAEFIDPQGKKRVKP